MTNNHVYYNTEHRTPGTVKAGTATVKVVVNAWRWDADHVTRWYRVVSVDPIHPNPFYEPGTQKPTNTADYLPEYITVEDESEPEETSREHLAQQLDQRYGGAP